MLAQIISNGALGAILIDRADCAGKLNAGIKDADRDDNDKESPRELRVLFAKPEKRPGQNRQTERKQN